MSQIRGHMFKFLYTGCNMFPEYNQKLGLTENLEELINIVKEMKVLMKDVKLEDKYGWYMRHRSKNKDIEKQKKKDEEKKKKENNINYEDIEIDSLF